MEKPVTEGTEESTAFDAAGARVFRTVTRQPLNRETLVEILEFCTEERPQRTVEDHILATPSNVDALISPYGLMQQLVNAGGLERTEVDEEGNVITDSDKEVLTEDEVDDLIADERYLTTDAGRTVIAYFAPQRRIERLLDALPGFGDSFMRTLAYCNEPRTRTQVEGFIREKGLLDRAGSNSQARPSLIIDKLEAAGLLQWSDHAWHATDAGRRYLKANVN